MGFAGRQPIGCVVVALRLVRRRSSVFGVTGNGCHDRRGSTRLSATNTSRSRAVSLGRRVCRRRIASSCRSRTISSCFEPSLRPSSSTSANGRQATTETNDTSTGGLRRWGSGRYRALGRSNSSTAPLTIEFVHPRPSRTLRETRDGSCLVHDDLFRPRGCPQPGYTELVGARRFRADHDHPFCARCDHDGRLSTQDPPVPPDPMTPQRRSSISGDDKIAESPLTPHDERAGVHRGDQSCSSYRISMSVSGAPGLDPLYRTVYHAGSNRTITGWLKRSGSCRS